MVTNVLPPFYGSQCRIKRHFNAAFLLSFIYNSWNWTICKQPQIFWSAECCGCLAEGRGRFTFCLRSIRFLHGLREGGWGVGRGTPLPTDSPPHGEGVPDFFPFWTSKWQVSVHCGTPVGDASPILPLDPPLGILAFIFILDIPFS